METADSGRNWAARRGRQHGCTSTGSNLISIMITTTTTTIKQQVEILKQIFIDLPKPWLPLALAPLADPVLPTGLLNRHHISIFNGFPNIILPPNTALTMDFALRSCPRCRQATVQPLSPRWTCTTGERTLQSYIMLVLTPSHKK